METGNARTVTYADCPQSSNHFGGDDESTRQRLEILLAANAESAQKKSLYTNEQDALEAATMKNPLSDKQAFAYFGLLLGTIPPAAIFTRAFINDGAFRFEDLWVVGIIAVVNLIAAVTAYFTGKVVGKIVGDLEQMSWTKMLLILPFVGILWGILSGGAGGTIIFLIGAVFGGALGAMVGGCALPIFAILHRLLKKEDKIARKHFLPIAFGTTFIVSAYILGL